MSSKKLKNVAKKQSAAAAVNVNLTLKDASLLGLGEDGENERPYVNLKHYWPDHQCFSTWTADELKAFSSFCRKIGQTNWAGIYRTGGAPSIKTGLGYTPHKNTDYLPANPELKYLSLDLTWFELRVDSKCRVHGFRAKEAFFLVFLDKNHEVYSA